jgi:hypothetical protein
MYIHSLAFCKISHYRLYLSHHYQNNTSLCCPKHVSAHVLHLQVFFLLMVNVLSALRQVHDILTVTGNSVVFRKNTKTIVYIPVCIWIAWDISTAQCSDTFSILLPRRLMKYHYEKQSQPLNEAIGSAVHVKRFFTLRHFPRPAF